MPPAVRPASPPTPMQRSHGAASVCFRSGPVQARLADLAQRGSAKAFLPRTSGPPEVVFLNTSGGLTDGDSLGFSLDLADHCHVIATTQTAERVYASRGDAAKVSVSARLGAGARLDWLPQETILFESSHLDRCTTFELAGTASALVLESLVLGRAAMGETPADLCLRDHRMIRRAGRPVWAETFALGADALAGSSAALLPDGARALAVIALVAPNAQDATGPLRAVLDQPGCSSAASGWDGRCLVRIAAADSWSLRRQVIRALGVLRPGPLPRVWQG